MVARGLCALFYESDTNDNDLEVQFRERPEVVKHDTVVAHCEELQRRYDSLAAVYTADSLTREAIATNFVGRHQGRIRWKL